MKPNSDYLTFSASDFAGDEAFQDWVLRPNEENETFWKNFTSEHPSKKVEIDGARMLVHSIQFKKELPTDTQVEESLQKALEHINAKGHKIRRMTPLTVWWAAAAILIILATGFYFLGNRDNGMDLPVVAQQNTKQDIAPGGNKAMLKLEDGTTIVLDSANNGMLISQGNTKVVKQDNGKLVYESSTLTPQSTTLQYNTLSTPRGGKYQLTLSDGSKVWLNSMSSLRFPAVFIGSERIVEVTGEVYFEVAHDAKKPFFVKYEDMVVKVLGTNFNVQTYTDAPSIEVTLLEGAINVSKADKEALLSPGWQAGIGQSGTIKINKQANIDEVMAWKNGNFVFARANIQTVMRQLSRWYNMEVHYEGNVTAHFGGTISMNVPVSKVFEMLEMTGGVKFKITGNKVIVLPGK